MTVTATHVTIGLQAGCDDGFCIEFSHTLHRTLTSGRYDICSTLEIPGSIDNWRDQHRTARKRADRAHRLGYRFHRIERHQHVDDIWAINTSTPERQGRPMSAGYLERPSATPLPPYTCALHSIQQNGVLDKHGRLVAYLWMYRSGDLALVSQILGHADHLRGDVMYLLFQGALSRETYLGGWCVYNRHDSGSDGLRYFKERLGFQPGRVEWTLA
jgi:hypothetical protein